MCFGQVIAYDRDERNHRLIENSLRLVRAVGFSAADVETVIESVYRFGGGTSKESLVGGVMVYLACLCDVLDLNMHKNGELELERIWAAIGDIRKEYIKKPRALSLQSAIN